MERAFDFVLEVANQDLAIYLDVNETSNSIVQDRPTWTNIEVTDLLGNPWEELGCGFKSHPWGVWPWVYETNHPTSARRGFDSGSEFLLAQSFERLFLRLTRIGQFVNVM